MCPFSRLGGPGKEPRARACLALPERARAGAPLGPGAGGGRRGRGWPGVRARAVFGASGTCTGGHCQPRPRPWAPPRAALRNPSLGRHALASGRRRPASRRTCRRRPREPSLGAPGSPQTSTEQLFPCSRHQFAARIPCSQHRYLRKMHFDLHTRLSPLSFSPIPKIISL